MSKGSVSKGSVSKGPPREPAPECASRGRRQAKAVDAPSGAAQTPVPASVARPRRHPASRPVYFASPASAEATSPRAATPRRDTETPTVTPLEARIEARAATPGSLPTPKQSASALRRAKAAATTPAAAASPAQRKAAASKTKPSAPTASGSGAKAAPAPAAGKRRRLQNPKAWKAGLDLDLP